MAVTFINPFLFGGGGGGGGGGISFVGMAFNEGVGSALVIDLTSLSAGTLAQDDIVVVCHAWASGINATMGFNTSGYTTIQELYANDSDDTNFLTGYKIMGATPDTSVSLINSANNGQGCAAIAMVFRGVDGTTPLDGVAAVTAGTINTIAPTPGSITPATAGAWVVNMAGGAFQTGTPSWTPPSNMTTAKYLAGSAGSTRNVLINGSYYDAWTSGAFTPAAYGVSGDSTSYSCASVSIVLRPA